MVCSVDCFLKQSDLMCIYSLLSLKQFHFSHGNLSINTSEDFSRTHSEKSEQLLLKLRKPYKKSVFGSREAFLELTWVSSDSYLNFILPLTV